MANDEQLTSDTEPVCIYCGKENEWYRMKELAVHKRRCRHCSKMNVVWFYKVYVTEEFNGHLEFKKQYKKEVK